MTTRRAFRSEMNWLHTWFGISLGTLLFMIFWMGTLSVFDKELDRWMQPETRLAPAEIALDADDVLERIRAANPDAAISSLLIYLPRERKRFFEVIAELADGTYYRDRLHPATGESLGPELTGAASGFIYPMHYRLLIPGGLGYWLVAFATLFMMVLVVTGVVIHRKIFKDFFTFRPKKSIGRSSLDLHNVTGTVFLPFHFVICLSGLAIFAGFYASLPFALLNAAKPDNEAVKLIYSADDYAYYQRPAAGEAAEMLPLVPMVERAEAIWTERYGQAAAADRIDVHRFGDRHAYVEVRRHFPGNRAEAHRDSVNFDGSTGVILQDFQATPVRQVRTWLEGFHQAQFDHWPLLWLYFIAGIAGCLLIATGFIYWLRSRRRRSVARQPVHLRLVEAMSAGSTSGVIVATLGYLLVNRLLDGQTEALGLDRDSLEVRSFFVLWLLTFLYAVVRGERAWMEQSWAIAGLALAAATGNWITTGAHPLRTAADGLWAVFGVDLVLLISCVIAGCAAWRLRGYGSIEAIDAANDRQRDIAAGEVVSGTK